MCVRTYICTHYVLVWDDVHRVMAINALYVEYMQCNANTYIHTCSIILIYVRTCSILLTYVYTYTPITINWSCVRVHALCMYIQLPMYEGIYMSMYVLI